MKKAIIQLKFDEEKVTALTKYMTKKGMNLETELQDTIQKFYERYVPPAVREYIETRELSEGRTSGGVRSQERVKISRDTADSGASDSSIREEESPWNRENA